MDDNKSQILDKDGKPVEIKPAEPPIPQPHKFGTFIIPQDVYIKGVTTWNPTT